MKRVCGILVSVMVVLVVLCTQASRLWAEEGVGEKAAILFVCSSGCDYTSIQAAIDAAADGDTVIVRRGTYRENLVLNNRAITLRSADGPADTIVDGDAANCCVLFAEGDRSVFDGFTLRNGRQAAGGGLRCYNSSPTITNCIVTGNEAYHLMGGGIYCYNSSPVISNCIVTRNTFTNSNGFGGGGIGCYSASSPAIVNCIVYGNTAVSAGGGISAAVSSHPVVTNSILWGNSVNGSLDQVYAANGSSVAVSFCNVQQSDGVYPGIGNINAYPEFQNPGGDYFQLLEDSPCIDAGTTLAADMPTVDIMGHARPVGGGVDMGAFEYAARADLVVGSIQTDPDYPRPGEPFTATFTIKNQGQAAGGGFWTALHYPCDTIPCPYWDYRMHSGLDADGGASFTVDLSAKSAGTYDFSANTDSGAGVDEGNEKNNFLPASVLVGDCPFTSRTDYGGFSMWFGGDDREAYRPRNLGLGKQYIPPSDCIVNSVGFEFSGPFSYDNSDEGHEVTLSLALRAEDLTILDRAEKTVPADFSGGWIFFDTLFEMEGGRKYYFTSHLKDGEITGYNTGVTGRSCPDWPPYPPPTCRDDSYSFQVNAYGQDMEALENWKKVWAHFNLHVSGIFTGACLADSDVDQDVDGADLAVFSGDFAASNEAADLNADGHVDNGDVAVFAAELGRTDCPSCIP